MAADNCRSFLISSSAKVCQDWSTDDCNLLSLLDCKIAKQILLCRETYACCLQNLRIDCSFLQALAHDNSKVYRFGPAVLMPDMPLQSSSSHRSIFSPHSNIMELGRIQVFGGYIGSSFKTDSVIGCRKLIRLQHHTQYGKAHSRNMAQS